MHFTIILHILYLLFTLTRYNINMRYSSIKSITCILICQLFFVNNSLGQYSNLAAPGASQSIKQHLQNDLGDNKKQLNELTSDNLRLYLSRIKTAEKQEEKEICAFLGLENNAPKAEIRKALIRQIFRMHPDMFTNDQERQNIAGEITVVLLRIKERFEDAHKGVFTEDDSSFFGAVDDKDLYRLRVIRKIKEDFFGRMTGYPVDAVIIPGIYPQQGEVRLVRDKNKNEIHIFIGWTLLGRIMLDDNNNISGIKLDYSFYPSLSHGTAFDELFVNKRIKLVEQLCQEPFLALYLLHQLNCFRNYFQVIPKNSRKGLSFSFDVLGGDSLGSGIAGRYGRDFGIFVPLDSRHLRETLEGIGTFAHEYQHLNSDYQGDSASEQIRRISEATLRERIENFHRYIIVGCFSPEERNVIDKMRAENYEPALFSEYPAYLNRDTRFRYHLERIFLPVETKLALNDLDRIYKKTGRHIKDHLLAWAKKKWLLDKQFEYKLLS